MLSDAETIGRERVKVADFRAPEKTTKSARTRRSWCKHQGTQTKKPLTLAGERQFVREIGGLASIERRLETRIDARFKHFQLDFVPRFVPRFCL